MQHLQKLKQFYKSGRYQCDTFFYTTLQHILTTLSLYQYLPQLLTNKAIVTTISQLSAKHLQIIQQQDNQKKALQILQQINRYIAMIDKSYITDIFVDIQKMNGKSYQQLLYSYINNIQFNKNYVDIYNRITKNVHDCKIKLDQLIILGLFVSKNGHNLEAYIQMYGIVLENGIKEMRKYRQNYQFIQQHYIEQHSKVRAYMRGSKILIYALIRFNQIYKLISGDNKYGLKLSALRKDIQFSYSNKKQINNSNHSNSNGNGNSNSNICRPFKQFKQFLVCGASIPNICSLCMYKTVDVDHIDCTNAVKLFQTNK